MAFRGQTGARLSPVSDLLDLGDISSVSLPYLMSKEPVMRTEESKIKSKYKWEFGIYGQMQIRMKLEKL